MNLTAKSGTRQLITTGIALLFGSNVLFAQVSPAEIRNPKLKALEKVHMAQLMELKQEIAAMRFPYPFILSRYVGLEPKNQPGADQRGLEFVHFRNRTVLKVSGNYKAAFNANLLTANQRANQVLDDVVVPVLTRLVKRFPDPSGFDAFGFEISYHVRRPTQRYGYEGKENLVIVFSTENALAYLKAQQEAQKQEILSASETFVDGKELGIALGQRDPLVVGEVQNAEPTDTTENAEQEPPPPARKATPARVEMPGGTSTVPEQALPPTLRTPSIEESVKAIKEGKHHETVAATPVKVDVDVLQKHLQPQLDALAKEGAERFHFVDYAPPSLVLFRDKIFLQLTLRNPALFDRNTTSIYKRAAQSFDLFLAPSLKDILAKIPESKEITGLDITVLDQFAVNSSSPEAVEYVIPISNLRAFDDYSITNQDLINQSIVLVNGVRISLDLQKVE